MSRSVYSMLKGKRNDATRTSRIWPSPSRGMASAAGSAAGWASATATGSVSGNGLAAMKPAKAEVKIRIVLSCVVVVVLRWALYNRLS